MAGTQLQHHETLERRDTLSALTDNYVDTVIGHLPENSKSDIAAEIKATADDMVEDRLGDLDHPAQHQAAAAEREVLEELGDPLLLPREYTNSPQHLIGPKPYPLFIWPMRWVIPLVAVISLTANAVAFTATQNTVQIGALIGQVIGNTVTALLVAFAAITIILTLGDRGLSSGSGETINGTRKTWSVDQLRTTNVKAQQIRAEAILGLIFSVLLALIRFIPTSLFYVGHLNNRQPFINSELGSGWFLGYWGFLVLMAIVEAVKLVRSSTSPAVLLGGAIIEVAIWVIVIWDQISTWRTHRTSR